MDTFNFNSCVCPYMHTCPHMYFQIVETRSTHTRDGVKSVGTSSCVCAKALVHAAVLARTTSFTLFVLPYVSQVSLTLATEVSGTRERSAHKGKKARESHTLRVLFTSPQLLYVYIPMPKVSILTASRHHWRAPLSLPCRDSLGIRS